MAATPLRVCNVHGTPTILITMYKQQNPDAKPLENKGWKHYEPMKDLVPVKTGRDNTFFPTAVQHSNIANNPSNSTSTSAVTGSQSSFDEIHVSNLGSAFEGLECSTMAAGQSLCASSATIVNSDIRMGPAPNADAFFGATQQPPLDPSIFTSAPPSTASGKRKAIEDDDSAISVVRPSHSTKSGDSGKSPRLSMPLAIQQMGSNLLGLNSTFEHATNAFEVNTSNTIARSVDPIPLHRQKAVLQLQDEDLEDHQLLTILNKFQGDIAIVDIYLAIKKPRLRKMFLEQHCSE